MALVEAERRSLARLSVPDLAYHILKRSGQPLHYRDLIGEVLEVKEVSEGRRSRAMAEAHTEITLDPRFQYLGQARWGLKEWSEKDAGEKRVAGEEEAGSEAEEEEECPPEEE